MAFTPAFTITPTSNPSSFIVTDTSVGTDASIVDRQIVLQEANGVNLATIDFPLSAGSAITISPLTQDISLNVIINWNYAGGIVTYTVSILQPFTQFGENFYYTLIQTIQSTPSILNDTSFIGNFFKFRALLDASSKAISTASDQAGAQTVINMYNLMITNQQDNF